MLLAPDYTETQAEARLADLRERLVGHSQDADAQYNHSLSYGVIEVQKGNSMTASELLSVADEKMYNFKKSHKAQRGA
jgi:GGDEF domain-containing protein